LRRQAEAKALRCDKAEESSFRIATEVCMPVCRCVCVQVYAYLSVCTYLDISLCLSLSLPLCFPPTALLSLIPIIPDRPLLTPQIADLRTTLQQQSSALEILQRSEASNADTAAHLEREKALLVSDKAFLQSELRNSEQQCDDKARENEGNVTRRNALEAKVPFRCLSVRPSV
jgi:hypothetical protein